MRGWLINVLQRWAQSVFVARVQQLEKANAEWKAALAAEQEKTGRLASVEKVNGDQATKIARLENELLDAQTQLRAAQAENRLLSEIHESDVSRRRRERAIYDRDRAIATSSAAASEEESEALSNAV